jgi:hypothetical protein
MKKSFTIIAVSELLKGNLTEAWVDKTQFSLDVTKKQAQKFSVTISNFEF